MEREERKAILDKLNAIVEEFKNAFEDEKKLTDHLGYDKERNVYVWSKYLQLPRGEFDLIEADYHYNDEEFYYALVKNKEDYETKFYYSLPTLEEWEEGDAPFIEFEGFGRVVGHHYHGEKRVKDYDWEGTFRTAIEYGELVFYHDVRPNDLTWNEEETIAIDEELFMKILRKMLKRWTK